MLHLHKPVSKGIAEVNSCQHSWPLDFHCQTLRALPFQALHSLRMPTGLFILKLSICAHMSALDTILQ